MRALAGLGDLWARVADIPSWGVGLVVALLGIGGAFVYFSDAFTWWFVVGALGAIAVSLVFAWVAETRLPEAPVESVRTFGWRTLATLMLAGLGSTIVIAIAAEITTPKDSPADQEELVKAVAAALTAVVTASLIKASEGVDAPTAGAAQAAFENAYADKFPNASPGRRAVFDDGWQGISGWSRKAREKRAAIVKTEWDKLT